MKTKLQIFKESTLYIFALGFSSGILHSILSLFFGEESWLALGLSGLLSFVATCILMGYLFEKEKPLWLASLQYIIIGILAILLTVIISVIGFPFVVDFISNQARDFVKDQISSSGFAGIILIIPMIFVALIFVLFGLFAYLAVIFFLGNWFFSFLLQWGFIQYKMNSSRNISSNENKLN